MGGGAKAVVAIVIVIAIVIPIALSGAMVSGNPYFARAPTVPSGPTTTTSGGSNIVYLPQGAGSGANFSPVTLTVKSGTTVMFVDQDTVPHNVYFTSVPNGATNPNPANVPVLTQGKSYNVTLTTPGTYSYICQFHSSWMKATIVVTP